jgi:hypothetical protein
MNDRKVLRATLAGVIFTIIPLLVEGSIDSDQWRTGAALFMIPGALVGMALAGGGIHNIALPIVILTNFLFYSGVGYLVFFLWKKRRDRSRG